MRARAFAFTALLAAAACGVTSADGRWEPRPGELLADVNQPAVRVPAQVKVGEEFSVMVTTQGDACVRRGGTDVSVSAAQLSAEVRPFDLVNAEAEGCARILLTFEHVGRVRFDRAGDATVVVHGLHRVNGMPEPTTVTARVRVVN